jgi:hypothetical protein
MESTNGELCVVQEVNLPWLHSHGTPGQKVSAYKFKLVWRYAAFDRASFEILLPPCYRLELK